MAALDRPRRIAPGALEAIGVTDPELGREVEGLLAHHAEEEFLEHSAAPGAWRTGAVSWSDVRQYQIESQLGEGGMGLVFLAQDRALDRPVALEIPVSHDPTAGRRATPLPS